MSAALKLPPRHMTVAEFLDWNPEDGSGALWQLRDGEPMLMPPASDRHGRIQGRLAYLITGHLDSKGGLCSTVIASGVVPRVSADHNVLIPDIGVTFAPPNGGQTMSQPVLLIEILSSSNEAQTRANIWAYTTIPTVQEILILHTSSIRAEVLRRADDGNWPERPLLLGPDDDLRLDSIGFTAPLPAAYVNSGLP